MRRSGAAKQRALGEYNAKRNFANTPEPAGRDGRAGRGARFVVQEHHARSLHWDLRLERDGVLVSWAVPKGIPDDPKRNRPRCTSRTTRSSYIDFAGEIPSGSYGAGSVRIWDDGTYESQKFREDEVIAIFHGERLAGSTRCSRRRTRTG